MLDSFVSHLESPIDGTRFPFGQVHTTHADRPLLVQYDLARARKRVSRDWVAAQPPDLWRYRPLLPVGDQVVSLGELMTPLLAAPRLARALGLKRLYVKDESRLPTGSFKARGMAVAITMALALGIRRVALPTQGNAGGAAAAYCARAGIECDVFMPRDTPEANRVEASLFGAKVHLVDGLIGDCGALVREGREKAGWFDLSTMREPYRLEGKKTMGFELAEQLGWKLPDVILYPTGGGTGLIGIWKAFQELRVLGWLDTGTMPRLFACQSTGCAPIVRAFDRGERHAEAAPDPHTVASGLRVPSTIGDFLILDAVRASGGRAMAAEESRLVEWTRRATELEGISLCPEAGACVGALDRAVTDGSIRADETVVLFNTGAAQKYVEALRPPGPPPVR
jgi:threonine synthase